MAQEHVFSAPMNEEVLVLVPVVYPRTRKHVCKELSQTGQLWRTMVVTVLVLFWCAQVGSGSPYASRRSKQTFVGDNVQNYLMHFGYLPQSDLETGNLRTQEQLTSAIKTLQAFGHVEQTGVMDDATRKLLRKPRCGLPDVDPSGTRSKRYALHGRKWDYTNLTWSLRTLYPRNLDPRLVRTQLDRALDVWAQNSKLSFTQVNSERADILVYFEKGYHGDGYPFDGRGQILAHAFFPGDGRGGDAHFDEEENWVLDEVGDDIEGTSLFAVAAHEFGHSLGLSHSSVQGALMYPWYQGIKPNFQLPDDDRYGIEQLYGPKDVKWRLREPHTRPEHYPPSPTRPPPPPPTRPPPPPTRPPPPPARPTPPRTRPTPPRYPYDNNPPPPPRYPQDNNPPARATPRPWYPPPQYPSEKPDTCNTSYDAISVIRGEVFIFKGKYLWRIGTNGLLRDYPAETILLWRELPKNFTHIDAVYERNDKKIIFFIGKLYYLFNGNTLERGYPRPLTRLGLPESLDKVDGAMVWGHNKKTYFFSGTMYWRFDEDVGTIELDYPRDMSMWKGVGYNIDTVFQWKDGKTYFFKGKGFWKFNDQHMRIENEKQMLSAPFWMGCPRELESSNPNGVFSTNKASEEDVTGIYSSASARIRLDVMSSMVLVVLCWRYNL